MKNASLLVLILLCVNVLADDAKEPPKSPVAVAAIKECDHAVEVAETAFKAAKSGADKKLIEKLKVAMIAATKAGNLPEANAIDGQIKASDSMASDADSDTKIKAADLPKSPSALNALKERDRAVESARVANRQAKAAADKKLIDKLKIALLAATKSGDLDEANRINARIKESQGAIGNTTGSPKSGENLLKSFDLSRDVISGKWKFDGSVLVSSSEGAARVNFQSKPSGSYEIAIEYGNSGGTFAVLMPVGESEASVSVSKDKIGIDGTDGKEWFAGETAKAGDFASDKRRRVMNISVQYTPPNARIIVLYDGKRQIDWTGPISKLRVVAPSWPSSGPPFLGIGSWQSASTVSKFFLRESAPVQDGK